MACSLSHSYPPFFCCSGTRQPSGHENRYGRPCELLCQYFSMSSLGDKLSLPSTMRPTIVASLRMHCLQAIFLSILEASSLACKRDLIMAEVYHRLWYILIIIPTLQCAVNLRERRQSFVSAVSGHIMATVLGEFSLSNRAFGIRRDNCWKTLRMQTTSSSIQSRIAS